MESPKERREIAADIVDALLTTHSKDKGTRLAVKQANPSVGLPEIDLGGWGREPAIDQVDQVLKQHMP